MLQFLHGMYECLSRILCFDMLMISVLDSVALCVDVDVDDLEFYFRNCMIAIGCKFLQFRV